MTSSHPHSFGGRLTWRLERAEHSGDDSGPLSPRENDEFRETLPPCPAEPPSSLLLVLGHRKKGATHQRRLLWDE